MKPNSSRFADKIQQNPKFSQRRWVNALFMCLPQATPSQIEQALIRSSARFAKAQTSNAPGGFPPGALLVHRSTSTLDCLDYACSKPLRANLLISSAGPIATPGFVFM